MRYRVFEFEKTVYKGNLAFDFFLFCLKQDKKLWKYVLILLYQFILFRFHRIAEEKFYISFFSFLKKKEKIDDLILKFWDSHYNKLYWPQSSKENWFISVLPLQLIEPALKEFGFQHVTATNYDFYSASLSGEIMKGTDLSKTLKEEMKKNKIDKFYGYHSYHKEVFESASNAYIKRSFGTYVPYTEKRLENKSKKIVQITIVIAILLFWILSINFAFSMKQNYVHQFIHYFKQPMLVLLNGIPILMLLLILYFLTSRLWVSFGIVNFVVLIMGFINRTKLVYRDDPFMMSDLTLFSESLEMAKRCDLNINLFIILLILCSLFMIFLLFLFRDKKKISWKKRIIFGIILIGASWIGFKPIYQNTSLYNRVGDKAGINIWSNTQQFQIRGFVYPFLYSSNVSKLKKPESYDESKVKELLSKYQVEKIPTYEDGKQIHVISIMLEAYQDFSKFETVSLNKDIYKNFHDIEAKSYSGKIMSNVFAGGTINTERAYLTGYYNMPNFRAKTNSFVQYMRNSGYYTEAMHPIYGWFYNRRNVNELLGFHHFDYYENKYSKIQSSFLKDVDFFDYIIEGYENSKKEHQSYFHFTVTYQNHLPYSTEKLYDEEYLTRTSAMDDATYNMINNYLHGIESTNEALKKIVDYFEQENEPVVLLVFADHNPYLGESNIGYKQMGINLQLDTVEGIVNYAGVPYFIWANQDAKKLTGNKFLGEAPLISPMFLMSELFENLGWKGNEYLQYLTDLKKHISVIHKPWYQEETLVKELSEEGEKLLEEFYNVEYYWLKHYQK